jgi:hypothetical protein
MPAKVIRGREPIWQLIKITPDGKQQSQILEEWRPSFVDMDRNIYWVNIPPPKSLPSELKIAYGGFGDKPKEIATIHKQQFGAYIAGWVFSGPVVGVNKEGILARGDFWSRHWLAWLLLQFDQDGRFKVIGEEPIFARPIRSLDLPAWWMCDGEIYGIMREDVGEISKFWLVRLKF